MNRVSADWIALGTLFVGTTVCGIWIFGEGFSITNLLAIATFLIGGGLVAFLGSRKLAGSKHKESRGARSDNLQSHHLFWIGLGCSAIGVASSAIAALVRDTMTNAIIISIVGVGLIVVGCVLMAFRIPELVRYILGSGDDE